MATPARVRSRANLIPLYGIRGLRQDLLARLKIVQAFKAGTTLGGLMNKALERALPELERSAGITYSVNDTREGKE